MISPCIPDGAQSGCESAITPVSGSRRVGPRGLPIFDARSNVPKITKQQRPLTKEHFTDFERCFGTNPNGRSLRAESDSIEGRWRAFSIAEVSEHHYKLDSFKWLRDEDSEACDDSAEPEELIIEAMEELQLALDGLADLQKLLEGEETAA